MTALQGKKIAIFIEDLFNEYEFIYPYYRLQEAGASVVIAGNSAKEHRGENGMTAKTQVAFSQLDAIELDGIIIAGGYGPDKMRKQADCLRLVREMHQKKKCIAFICHAGWVPISAGILKGRKATGTRSIKDDMINAGCHWEDKAVVIDGNLISSRGPQDLPLFAQAIVHYLAGDTTPKHDHLS